MRTYITFLTFFAALFMHTEVVAQDEESNDPPIIAIRIPLGETANVEGHDITFKEVLEDSRCPTSVVCVWEGQIKILVNVEGVDKEFVFSKVVAKASKEHLILEEESLSIQALQVSPYPEKPGKFLDYVLKVVVAKD